MTIEANGHRVEFRNGSPYDPKNAGLHADITIPHYGYITAGSEYEKDPRFRNCSFTRVLEIMKGIVKESPFLYWGNNYCYLMAAVRTTDDEDVKIFWEYLEKIAII